MDTNLLWRIWTDFKKTALSYEGDGSLPKEKLERSLEVVTRIFGESWLIEAFQRGHPLTQLLSAWPGVVYFDQFADLLAYACQVSSPAALQELVHRTRTAGPAEFWSTYDELRVLWSLNQAGIPTRKLIEGKQVSKGHKQKSQDLACVFPSGTVQVEVTQLRTTGAAQRADVAFKRLTGLNSTNWKGQVSFRLEFRPYSEPHVSQLEQQMLRVIENAKVKGIGTLILPGILSYVIWDEGHANEAAKSLQSLALKPEVKMEIYTPSPISPYRVVQKLLDKRRQASGMPWVLFICAPESLIQVDQAQAYVQEVSEWIYDLPRLVGVVLSSQPDIFIGAHEDTSQLNLETSEISVCTTLTGAESFQQTVVLRNRFSDCPDASHVLDSMLYAGRKTGWFPAWAR